MSTKQPENQAADTTQQATSPTPTTKPAKNPKRVAAGKMVAERTGLAREPQKKAADEAAVIITNNKATPAVPAPAPATEDASPARSSLSTTQWFGAGTFVISLIGETGRVQGRIQQEDGCAGTGAGETTHCCAATTCACYTASTAQKDIHDMDGTLPLSIIMPQTMKNDIL